jgi:plastocyanin
VTVPPAVTARSTAMRSGALVLAAVVVVAALAAATGATVTGAAPRQATVEPNPTPTPYDVVFTPDGLRPLVIAVPVGATVRWLNPTDLVHGTAHVPELGQPVLWNSGDIAPLEGQFSFTFGAVGTFSYIDAYFADDVAFQGTVIVTRNDPTATPITPTAGPSPTVAPTGTPRSPTPTIPATPRPALLLGTLVRDSDAQCSLDARLLPCDNPTQSVWVRSDGQVERAALFGRDVRLEGVWTDCAATGRRYLWLSQAQVLPGGCGGPTDTPTPSPTPTVRPPFQTGENLALHRPVTAKRPELPGFEAERATDGDSGTTWYSADQVSWIYVDLGAPKTFNRVRLRWAYPYAERYGIYSWQDGAWQGRFMADNARGGEDVRTLAPAETQYVLVYLMRSSLASGGFALSELEVYGDEPDNWALGQQVVVSSQEDGREGRNAVDGAMDTWWVSRPGDANPWIGVYLPTSVDLLEFKLYWMTWYPRVYSLVFFERGQATFSAPVSSDGGLDHFRGRVPVRADTLMIYANQLGPEGRLGLQEIEFYGPGPGLVADGPVLPLGLVDLRGIGRTPPGVVGGSGGAGR